MPKLTCPCGHQHNLSPIPDDGHRTIPDQQIDSLLEADAQKGLGILDEYAGALYECPECGRVMWSKIGYDSFKIYVPEKYET